jgi:hypothetical protein
MSMDHCISGLITGLLFESFDFERAKKHALMRPAVNSHRVGLLVVGFRVCRSRSQAVSVGFKSTRQVRLTSAIGTSSGLHRFDADPVGRLLQRFDRPSGVAIRCRPASDPAAACIRIRSPTS